VKVACRYSKEERKPLNSKSRIFIRLPGDLISTSSKDTPLFSQGTCTILISSSFYRKMQISTGRCSLLQEGAVSTGRCNFYRKIQSSTGSADFLQEVPYLYRKLPVEVQSSTKLMFWENLMTKEWFGRL